MNNTGNTVSVSAFSMYKKVHKKKPKIRETGKRKPNIKSLNSNNITTSKHYSNLAPRKPSSNDNGAIIKEHKKSKNMIHHFNKSHISERQRVNVCDKPQLTMEWLIAPIQTGEFFETRWEKSPVFISRSCSDYYQELLTTQMLDHIIRTNVLLYTQNIDIVSYENDKRETHNPVGVVHPAVLWDYYNNKCSIRVLNPHTYCHKLHLLIAALQEYFGCMVGVNAYLTPHGSQGFAPHYDDIEAFVLQLEGRKHWKLYAPLTKAEVLPRYSSKNFERNELKTPLQELTVEAGDLLYFPRGIIHEGYTDADSHSLHVTISVYQKTAYIDLLEHTIKSALTTAVRLDPQYRKGLPLQYLKHTGLVNSRRKSNVRDSIIKNVKELITKLTDYISVDTAADELGKQFMWDAMPPVPSATEKSCMIYENSDNMEKGIVYNQVSITAHIKVRLLSYHCLRVVADEDSEDTVRVYHCTENAKYYHGLEQQFLIIDKTFVPGLTFLIHSYPKYIQVEEIPFEDEKDKLQLVSDLWERGLIVTERPLETSD